jgi:hypothetical protein
MCSAAGWEASQRPDDSKTSRFSGLSWPPGHAHGHYHCTKGQQTAAGTDQQASACSSRCRGYLQDVMAATPDACPRTNSCVTLAVGTVNARGGFTPTHAGGINAHASLKHFALEGETALGIAHVRSCFLMILGWLRCGFGLTRDGHSRGTVCTSSLQAACAPNCAAGRQPTGELVGGALMRSRTTLVKASAVPSFLRHDFHHEKRIQTGSASHTPDQSGLWWCLRLLVVQRVRCHVRC